MSSDKNQADAHGQVQRGVMPHLGLMESFCQQVHELPDDAAISPALEKAIKDEERAITHQDSRAQ